MKKSTILSKTILLLILIIAAFACSACEASAPEQSRTETTVRTGTISIATKNTPEQNILANLAEILIEEKMGVDAKIVYFDDSTSASLLKKLEDQKIQVFFDYSGSLAANAFLMDTGKANLSNLLLEVQNTAKKQSNITVSEQIGYNSITAFYMMKDRNAELNSFTTLSELAKNSKKLKIGMTEAFYNRIDCYQAICSTYKMHFKKATVYDEESGFVALAQGDIDVFVTASVNPYNSLFSMTQLTDDQHFFLPQEACYLVNDQALKDYPELETTLAHLQKLIPNSRMSLMIKRIYWEGNDIDEYLHTYLRANNII